MTTTKKERGGDFFPDYPRVDPGAIASAYAICQKKWANNPVEAYEHVKNCHWCQIWVKEHKKLEDITKLSPREVEERIKRIPKVICFNKS
jgi:hypothetical protein